MIYADYAATAPLYPEVLESMMPYLRSEFGNPSSIHRAGRNARIGVETARQQAADCLHAKVQEIFFTSGGTESDNWALKAAGEKMLAEGKTHLITTRFEHPAVLETCRFLSKHGICVTYLSPGNDGSVSLEQLKEAVTPQTGLVSVMYVNNEIGTIQPVKEIGGFCREKGILFHTDAVQAVGNLPVDLRTLPVDLLSLSGHKLGAPKGTGLLYVRNGIGIQPFVHGGGQERGRRAGTENVPGIVGLGQALVQAAEKLPEKIKQLSPLRDELENRLLRIPGAQINGTAERICSVCNISFSGIEGEAVVLSLDRKGICVSSGSACSSCGGKPSHVLTAMGVSEKLAKGAVRISLGEEHTRKDILKISHEMEESIKHLRELFGTEV